MSFNFIAYFHLWQSGLGALGLAVLGSLMLASWSYIGTLSSAVCAESKEGGPRAFLR